ncbi:hypothetical protein M5K25_004807 [Dendrobium thyrsiflorum]|uniref:Uncharacterized protein n=1 Tax=Dendrobium thyrsiflorum TaxID=117978 RepID=A0ABD0VN59_DENTH
MTFFLHIPFKHQFFLSLQWLAATKDLGVLLQQVITSSLRRMRKRTINTKHVRLVIPADINFNVMPLFSTTQLQFILTLTHAYHREIFLQFLSNLRVTPDSSRMSSYEDLGTYLHLRTEGVRAHNMLLEPEYNWTTINQVLRGIDEICHLPCVYTFYQNAWIIQHVLRS